MALKGTLPQSSVVLRACFELEPWGFLGTDPTQQSSSAWVQYSRSIPHLRWEEQLTVQTGRCLGWSGGLLAKGGRGSRGLGGEVTAGDQRGGR